MRKVLFASAICIVGLSMAMNASAFTKQMVRDAAGGSPSSLSSDCLISSGNRCAGWVWVFTAPENDVWGTVLDPNDCAAGCANGGAVTDITLRVYCLSAAPPGTINDISISAVDGVGCLTGTPLYSSGPVTVLECTSTDRWQTYTIPATHVNGNPFAVTVTWGPEVAGSNLPQFSTDNGIANLYCNQNPGVFPVFPGCGNSTADCTSWVLPAQHTYIYATDLTGDTVADDLCTYYGQPYPLSFPYFYPYGYLPNNLMCNVGLDCNSPTATESGSWGHVKSLYQ